MKTASLFATGAVMLALTAIASADDAKAPPADDRSDVIELDDVAPTPAPKPATKPAPPRKSVTAELAKKREPAAAARKAGPPPDFEVDEPVSTTTTTSAVSDERRDLVESRADERRNEQGRHFTAAPMFGLGSGDYGVGAGARFGYTFRTPVYVGGNFMYHAGDGRPSSLYPSVEVGYDVGVGSFVLRPYGGVGVLVRERLDADNMTVGLVYPGFTAHYLLPRSPAFVGADARALLPVGSTASLALTATTGLNF